jgi:hypothetical protein
LQYFETVTGKPRGTRSILKFTPVNWLLFLRFSETQMQLGGIRSILKLSSAQCTQWHGVCSVLQLKSVNCTVFATF